MRRFLIILTGSFFLWAPSIYAQFKEKPILNLENEDKAFLNWGYFLGMNQFDFKFAYKNDLPDI